MAREKGRKKKKVEDYFVIGLILPILLIIGWEVAANAGLVNQSILPGPSRILKSFIKQMKNMSLEENVLVSLQRVAIGYVIGAFFGILMGIFTGLYRLFNRIVSLGFEILRPIPVIAWVPVLILISGIGETSKIIVIVIGTFWSVFLNTSDGIRNVDKKLIEVSTIFKKRKLAVITKVILPAALPSIFTGLRLGVGTAWISVIGAELIAASSGLGFLISYSREMSQPASMFVGVFTIGLIGCLINILIRQLERHLLKWNVDVRR
jgi:sulfonate transport system permease protein